MGKQPLLNTYVDNMDMDGAVRMIEGFIAEKKRAYVVPVNVDVIMKIEQDRHLKKVVDEADMVLVDGKPLVWIANLCKKPVKAKVSGSDLVPSLCGMCLQKGYTLFIMGGREGVAERAKARLEKRLPGIQIKGTYAPPLGFEKDQDEIKKANSIISAAHPDLLIVCLGCPKQEKWIYENYQKYDALVSVCAGATVDFLAGDVKRAPKWMSAYGLEWFYRFLQEPRRLFKRYFIDDIKILGLVLKYRA